MSPDDWAQIRALFDEVVEQPKQGRTAFLDRALREASETSAASLRAEVEALLDAHDAVEAESAFVSPFATDPATEFAPDDAGAPGGDASPDVHVGPYRLVRPLGRGGMGTVYLAERVDGQFQQTVALKLIRRGLDTDDVLARFTFERQVLASLDHPNIARIYDGGVTPDGRPYFAMEYVDGEPITEYCDRKRLSTAERLALFQTVCTAVRHAHRNLVVHRDLKPSNIYVTERPDATGDAPTPQVKLLDFGIAKLLSEEGLGDLSVPRTRTGNQVLTPEYAAPEQLRGEAITTATDVYQLGILLYELLTGRRPYRLKSRLKFEIARAILEEDPERPSTAVGRTDEQPEPGVSTSAATVTRARSTDLRQLQRQLAGDLDVICLKALKKEPERRYPDVDALAEDLERHRTGRPVLARPDTFTYRASRFVRRHLVGVAASAVVLLAVLGGSGAVFWQSRVAAAERDRAEAALVQAEGTLAFLEDVIASGGPAEGDPDTPIGVVLDSAAARVDVELDAQPSVARAVHTSLAKVFFEMGRLDDAESSARAALARYEAETETAQDGRGYGRSAHVLGMILDYRDAHDASLRYHEDAIAHFRTQPDAEALLASALNTYAAALLDVNREADAEAALEESMVLFRALDDPDVLYPLSSLGVLHNYQGRFDEALPLFQEVVERLRAEHGGDHYELGEALGNLAGTLAELGRWDDALRHRREAVDMLAATVGEQHHSTIISRASLTTELLRAGDVSAAKQSGRAALDAAEVTFGPDHSLTAFAQNVAGQAYCAGTTPSEGAALLEASLSTRRTLLPAGHWLIANGESLLGGCLARAGRPDAALPLLRSGYDGLLDARGPDHAKTQEARERLDAVQGGP